MKMRKVDAGLGDLYFFPDEGKDLVDVSVTVNWGPYQDGILYFVTSPFRAGRNRVGTTRRVEYPGRTHAKNAREAGKIARELFSHSVHCLRLDHYKCEAEYASHLAHPRDWPDAPRCECKCHD